MARWLYVDYQLMKRGESNKYLLYVALGVAIGLLAFILAAINTPLAPKTATAPAPAATAPAPDAVLGGESSSPSANYPRVGLPYIESGYRFQFSHCTGTPGSLVVKAGKYFLLDNRDAQSHTFAVAGQSYSVGGYGAAVAAVWKIGTFQITCDGGGAASLTVEK